MLARRPQHDLLFAHDFPPMGGGIARWMAALANGYPPGTLTVSTGSVAGSAAADAASPQRIDRVWVPVTHLGTLVGRFFWSRRAVRLARDRATRFAWCDTIRPAGYTAQWVFRRTRLPFGIMVVGNDILVLRARVAGRPITRRLMQSILGRAAAFVAISEWTAEQCRTLLRELDLVSAAARVRVVPLGTDPIRFHADPVGAASFRNRRGLPDGRWLVTVARLVEYKGIDTGVRLLARLRHAYPDLHYAVVGRGPYEAALRALATELGVADRVHLLTDVSDDELPAAYSNGEVYIGLTRETTLDVEGFGISFAEAAACGLPVIGARSGGIPDAVVDGETGVLVDPDDLAAVAAVARRLLGDPVLARRMGSAGRDRVERYLNWDRVVREMRGIAEELGRPPAS
jgi:phosphatidylinositol alpha-1,6-mannosyltransferase